MSLPISLWAHGRFVDVNPEYNRADDYGRGARIIRANFRIIRTRYQARLSILNHKTKPRENGEGEAEEGGEVMANEANISRKPWKRASTTGTVIYDADECVVGSTSGDNAMSRANAAHMVALANAEDQSPIPDMIETLKGAYNFIANSEQPEAEWAGAVKTSIREALARAGAL